MDKLIAQLSKLSLEGAAGVTVLASLLAEKSIISFEDYTRIKDEIKEILDKELDK